MAPRHGRDEIDEGVRRNALIVRVVGTIIIAVLIFSAGFLLRGNTALLDSLGFSSLSTEDQPNAGATVSGNTYDSLAARVAEVQGIIEQESLDEYPLEQATTDVIGAFLATTDDPYMAYLDEKSYQSYISRSVDPQAGVGVIFGESDGSCYAADVFDGSSAEAAGVQSGDFVDSIDGTQKDSWTMADVLGALSRADGESVYIVWRRPNASDEEGDSLFSTTLTFSEETTDNITYSIDDNVAFIDIKQISGDSGTVMAETIDKVRESGARAIVIDLRNVSGGYLTQAVEICSLFMQSGTVVQIKTKDATTAKTADSATVCDLPLVLLVNDKTAGAAEVMAASLQETNRATIVGTTTQGKGSVQVIQPLSFGGALRYTAATYLTPSGRAIDGNGVSPDITVNNESNQEIIATESAESLISN